MEARGPFVRAFRFALVVGFLAVMAGVTFGALFSRSMGGDWSLSFLLTYGGIKAIATLFAWGFLPTFLVLGVLFWFWSWFRSLEG